MPWGAIGGAIGGGLLDLWGSSREQDRIDAREATKIQTRVKDAEKAGVHPLFALGANVQSGPTTVTRGSLGDAARGIGNAIDRRQARKHEAAQNQSNVEANRAAARESNARAQGIGIENEIKRLELFRARQDLMFRGTDKLDVLPDGSQGGVQLGPNGVIDLTPTKIQTSDPNSALGSVAGRKPFGQWANVDPEWAGTMFGDMYLPESPNMSEALDNPIGLGLAGIQAPGILSRMMVTKIRRAIWKAIKESSTRYMTDQYNQRRKR